MLQTRRTARCALPASEAAIDKAATDGGDLYIDLTDVTFFDAAATRVIEHGALAYSARGRRLLLTNCNGTA